MGGAMRHLCQDAVDGALVHFAGHCIFTKTCGHGAQIIQRRHPQSHLCLLIAKLVNLHTERRFFCKNGKCQRSEL